MAERNTKATWRERRLLLRTVLDLAATACRLRLGGGRKGRGLRKRDGPLRVMFLSAYPETHYGTRSRLSLWIAPLESRGIEVTLRCPSSPEEYLAYGRGDPAADRRYFRAVCRNRARQVRAAAGFDAVLLHRGLLPFGPWQRPTFERLLARRNPRLVYDFYDAIWVHRRRAGLEARGRIGRWLNPPDLVESIGRAAAVVTVANPFLAAEARRWHPDVRTLPMVIETAGRPQREHRDRTPVVLSWTGSAGNLPKLRRLGPAIRVAAERAPLRLRVVSSASFDLEGVEVESRVHPYSPESELEDLQDVDIGLVPLGDSEIDRGKSPLKLLQFAGSGLPVVASPLAADRDRFRHEEAILYAEEPAAWTAAIVRLARDAALRADLGRAARRVVVEHHSVASQIESFAGLLEGVARGPEAARP